MPPFGSGGLSKVGWLGYGFPTYFPLVSGGFQVRFGRVSRRTIQPVGLSAAAIRRSGRVGWRGGWLLAWWLAGGGPGCRSCTGPVVVGDVVGDVVVRSGGSALPVVAGGPGSHTLTDTEHRIRPTRILKELCCVLLKL